MPGIKNWRSKMAEPVSALGMIGPKIVMTGIRLLRKRVLEQHHVGRQAFGSGGAHKILPHHFQQV